MFCQNIINSGGGNDHVLGESYDKKSTGIYYGIGQLRTGNGNDTVTGISYGEEGTGIAFGGYKRHFMGNGNDIIIGKASKKGRAGIDLYPEVIVDLGKGDDLIDASKGGFTTYDDSRPGVVIAGGGDDTVKGFGSGHFNGGGGRDRLLLPNGKYIVDDGTIAKGKVTMSHKNFEQVGNYAGNIVDLRDGKLSVSKTGLEYLA